MADSSVQIPPIRTNLSDPDLTDQTAKEWYLYWKNSGDRINRLNRMVGYGTHADRPPAQDAPDAAIYVETDRSVIYVNEGGEWHYLSGTMWGTLSPDQRPTDLGPNDAGFDFRTTDSAAAYTRRQFIWSGTIWVETTQPNVLQYITLPASYTLTTTMSNVPGFSVTLPRAGLYLITAIFDWLGNGAGDAYAQCFGQLAVNGVAQPGFSIFAYPVISGTGLALNPTAFRVQASQQWSYQAASGGQVAQILAQKNTGTGASTINALSTLAALWVSP